MTLWVTGQVSANTLTPTVANLRNVRAVNLPFTIPGLMPNSYFTFWLNNTDMTWATRQTGKKMGQPLLSDERGGVYFEFMAEMFTNEAASQDKTKYYQFELRDISGNKVASTVMPQTLAVRT